MISSDSNTICTCNINSTPVTFTYIATLRSGDLDGNWQTSLILTQVKVKVYTFIVHRLSGMHFLKSKLDFGF